MRLCLVNGKQVHFIYVTAFTCVTGGPGVEPDNTGLGW